MIHLLALLAAGAGEKVGQNVGNLLGGWARSLYVGVAAIVAIVFLLNRRYSEMAMFLLAAVLVGGFVLDPQGVESAVKDIWTTITG